MIVDIKKIGEAVVPLLFQELVDEAGGFAVYKKKEMQNLGSAQKEIVGGKLIVVQEADRKAAEKLLTYLDKKSGEMLSFENKAKISSKNFTRNRKKTYQDHQSKVLNSLLLVCSKNIIISFKQREEFPLLLSFAGSDYFDDEINEISAVTDQFLVPLHFLLKLEKKLAESTYVDAVGRDLYAGINVLVPKSQETTLIFKESLLKLKGEKEAITGILDMGCGSGVLSILSAQNFPEAHVFFTDLLPEAISSAKFNCERTFEKEFSYDSDTKCFVMELENGRNLTAYNSGNLFEHIDNKFDVILFNAPWIVTKARNRGECALNDEGQKVVAAFLAQAKDHLTSQGSIVLGYSDNSGDEAVERLEELIRENGYTIRDINSKRIQSYQSGRKWMKVFTYILEAV